MNTTGHRTEIARLSAKIIGETIRAKGTKILLGEIAREMIDTWAQKNTFRSKLSVPARWVVSKVFKPEAKAAAGTRSADVGRLLTEIARKVNADHAAGPSCHTGTRGEAIGDFLKHTDFGEIREMVEGSDTCVLKTIEIFNEQLWKYPAKVGTLVATLIPAMNTLMRALREILMPIEKTVGPDLLADILLSVVRGLNGKDMAKLANSLQEAIRRVHTGSLLLGKGGKPLFQIYLTDLLRDALPELDEELLKKVRIALAEDREAIANSLADTLRDNPGITLAFLASLGRVKTSDIKTRSRRLGVIEELDAGDLKAAVSESMSEFDTYEAAGLLNTLLRVANRIHDARPDIMSNILSGIVDSVDVDEVGQTARWLIPEFTDAVRPIATEVMPVFLKFFAELMNPADGSAGPEHTEALKAFRSALAAGGER